MGRRTTNYLCARLRIFLDNNALQIWRGVESRIYCPVKKMSQSYIDQQLKKMSQSYIDQQLSDATRKGRDVHSFIHGSRAPFSSSLFGSDAASDSACDCRPTSSSAAAHSSTARVRASVSAEAAACDNKQNHTAPTQHSATDTITNAQHKRKKKGQTYKQNKKKTQF